MEKSLSLETNSDSAKKTPAAFYGTWKFITLFAKARL
jgi:hypothetical protein